jgi:hypothetical protein
MSDNYLQKSLKSLPPVLDDIIGEPVREHLSRQRRDCDAGGLALEDIAEVFEVAVSPADAGELELCGKDISTQHDRGRKESHLEGGDVCLKCGRLELLSRRENAHEAYSADYLVVGVHLAPEPVGLRVLDLLCAPA